MENFVILLLYDIYFYIYINIYIYLYIRRDGSWWRIIHLLNVKWNFKILIMMSRRKSINQLTLFFLLYANKIWYELKTNILQYFMIYYTTIKIIVWESWMVDDWFHGTSWKSSCQKSYIYIYIYISRQKTCFQWRKIFKDIYWKLFSKSTIFLNCLRIDDHVSIFSD